MSWGTDVPPPSKVIGLNGKPVEDPADKQSYYDKQVVDLLEKILEQARAGRIDGVAIMFTEKDSDQQRLYQSAWQGPRLSLLGAMTRALYAMNVELNTYDRGNVTGPDST